MCTRRVQSKKIQVTWIYNDPESCAVKSNDQQPQITNQPIKLTFCSKKRELFS